MDWKDMLSQIREDLPEGEENSSCCIPEESNDSSDKKREIIHIVTEKKGRKGKTATIAEGFLCSEEELDTIASELKRKLGVGGSARGGEILIQGDCRNQLALLLKERGYRIK